MNTPRIPGQWLINEDDERICLVVGRTVEEREAHATFIETACNAHEELVAVLRDAPCTCEHETGLGMMCDHNSDDVACYRNRVLAVLAKAGVA